jgi:hypothetical protein
MSRFGQRTNIQQPSVGGFGKPAPTGIGVIGGYGIATGGSSSSITVSSTAYTLLTFSTDANLVVSTGGLFDVMMFAGGGGGGSGIAGSFGGVNTFHAGGGGGAGGRVQTTLYLAAATYAVSIGAGGAGNTKGLEALIGTVVQAVGGGGGGGGGGQPLSQTGGSGSGNNGYFADGISSTVKVLQQGNLGGIGLGDTAFANPAGGGNRGGGGGGFSGVGDSGGSTGNGGAGVDVSTFISGSALFKAGGGGGGRVAGGGGAGGSSVGGAGTSSSGSGGSASANTASGGGGGYSGGGSGGSGIVYVRFRV